MTNQKNPLRIVVTNDDGIHAEGIRVLEDIALEISSQVWVVAPQTEQSGVGGALTYRDPLRLNKLNEKRYSVNGTPTDCIILAVEQLFKNDPPDLVLSGINAGENLGESVPHSGTIAAAIKAAMYGVPAIALSHVTKEQSPIDWTPAIMHGAQLIRNLLKVGWKNNVMLNVNFPHCKAQEVKGVKVVQQGRRSIIAEMVECVDPRGYPYYWVGTLHEELNPVVGTDLWAINEGYIAVTPLNLDMTDQACISALSSYLEISKVQETVEQKKVS